MSSSTREPSERGPTATTGGSVRAGGRLDDDYSTADERTPGAAESVREAGDRAKDAAQRTAGQAQGRIRQEIDRRSAQAGDQVYSTARDLRAVGEELRDRGKDGPAKLADQAAARAEQVAGYLRGADADRLLEDVENFARRQPWAVAAGALVVGFAGSRFLKSSSQRRSQSTAASSTFRTRGPEEPETAASEPYGYRAGPTERQEQPSHGESTRGT
jgi:hypothetical protein